MKVDRQQCCNLHLIVKMHSTESIEITGIIAYMHSNNPDCKTNANGRISCHWTYPENCGVNAPSSNKMWTWYSLKDVNLRITDDETMDMSQDLIDDMGDIPLVLSATVSYNRYGTLSASNIWITDRSK
jgi:hypothetical protein